MTRLIWLLFLLGTYVWVVSSGKEETLFRGAKIVYEAICDWLDGADADFQLKEKKAARKSKRWR